ncbi:MAG: hypothetical protein FD122_3780, partial [Stygiobacter sp.]
ITKRPIFTIHANIVSSFFIEVILIKSRISAKIKEIVDETFTLNFNANLCQLKNEDQNKIVTIHYPEKPARMNLIHSLNLVSRKPRAGNRKYLTTKFLITFCMCCVPECSGMNFVRLGKKSHGKQYIIITTNGARMEVIGNFLNIRFSL